LYENISPYSFRDFNNCPICV